MDTTYSGLRRHYARLSDDDLRHIAVTAAELTEDAQHALRDELSQRGIADTAVYEREIESRAREHEEYLEQRRLNVERGHRFRVRYSVVILGVLFCAGAWRLIIDGDQTNGIGMMVATAIVLPVVLAYAYLRRAFFRFALRK